MTEANTNPLFREAGVSVELLVSRAAPAAQAVIDQQVDLRRGFYDRNHVPVIRGQARFVDPHTIEVDEANGGQAAAHGRRTS